jgi:hypothetical protein
MMRESNVSKSCHTKRPIKSINGYHKKKEEEENDKREKSIFSLSLFLKSTTAVTNENSMIIFLFFIGVKRKNVSMSRMKRTNITSKKQINH